MKEKNKPLDSRGCYICHKCGFQSDMPLKDHNCGRSYATKEDYEAGMAHWCDLHPIDRKILEEQS